MLIKNKVMILSKGQKNKYDFLNSILANCNSYRSSRFPSPSPSPTNIKSHTSTHIKHPYEYSHHYLEKHEVTCINNVNLDS